MRNNTIKTTGRARKYILDNAKIINLFNSGHTKKEISKIFGVSEPTIKRRLKELEIRREKKYTLDQDVFSFFSPESCYWAGFCAADAWIGQGKKKKIRVELKSTDFKHLKKMCRFFKRDESAVRIIHRNKWNKKFSSCVLEIGNQKIVSDIVNNFNVTQAKSLVLLPPNNLPDDMIKHYIRGYFDGDGWVGTKDKKYNTIGFVIVSGSQNIIEWCIENLNKYLRIKLNMRHQNKISSLGASGFKAEQIFDWLYSDSTPETRLDRKYERYINYYKVS